MKISYSAAQRQGMKACKGGDEVEKEKNDLMLKQSEELHCCYNFYSVWKEHSWLWKTSIGVQIEKNVVPSYKLHIGKKKELLYIIVLTSTILFTLNYTFINGLMWLNSLANKQIFVAVNQNKEILHAFNRVL